MSLKYYVVTLQHEQERINWVKTHIIPNIKALSIDNKDNKSDILIYFGIDGRQMTLPEIIWWINHTYLPENYKINPAEGIPFRQGQIGCALSHIRIWEECYLSKIPYVCILEDDVQINLNQINKLTSTSSTSSSTSTLTLTHMEQIISELPDNWDHCNLYHHPKFQDKLCDPNLTLPNKHLIIKGVPMWGTVGYLLSQRGIKKLLKYVKPIFNTIDEMIKHLITKNILTSYTIKVPFINTIGHIVSFNNQINKDINLMKSTIWSSDPI